MLPEFNLCSITEVRALKNCLSLESCANLAFNDHREDIRVLTCSAGQNGNKILDSFRISSWSQMLIHSPVTSGHLISPDTGGMAAPEEVVRTHTHSQKNHSSKPTQTFDFLLNLLQLWCFQRLDGCCSSGYLQSPRALYDPEVLGLSRTAVLQWFICTC